MATPEKKLVHDVSGWLRIYDDGSVERVTTGPPHVKFMTEPVPAHDHFIHGVATRDVSIDRESGLHVRVYLPKKEESKKLPIVVHFHGGGFCISRPDWFMYYHMYTLLARRLPAIIVSVYFRLEPEHRLPAQADDGFSTLLWLQSLARGERSEPWLNENGDFERVFLIGDSAGGNLVHEVAAMAGKEGLETSPLRLAGGILIQPAFIRSVRSKSELERPESPFLALDMLDKFLSLALPVGSTKDHPITCPMGAAAPPLEGLRLPPLLLFMTDKDLIWDTEMEYYEAMKKAGKAIELLVNHGIDHIFYMNKIAVDSDPLVAVETEKLIHGIEVFIRKH